MLSPLFEGILRGADASFITDIFIFSLFAIFFGSIYLKFKFKRPLFTNYTPTLLTSLGILGTFTGIISGLLDFDTNEIQESIGPLLAGLKTAFITSLIGMLLSILFKIIVSMNIFDRKNGIEPEKEDISISDLYHAMLQQAQGIELLKKAINENDESSLVGQIKLLRSDASDNSKSIINYLRNSSESLTELTSIAKSQQQNFTEFEERLKIRLQDFADMLSKSATEQVIEALKQVIQDFNNNLIEQFGDNFKALNDAVLKLVTWQENYKEQLNEMKVQYEHGVQAITKTEESVNHISKNTQTIPETMNNLKIVMETNQHQINELDRHLDAFKAVRDKAVEAVPEIQEQIEHALAGAREANDRLASGIVESSNHIKTVISESADNYRDTVDQTRAALTESAQVTASSSEQIKQQFSDALTDINAHMRNLVGEVQQGAKSISDSYKDASNMLIADTKETSHTFSQEIDNMRRTLATSIEEQATEHRKQADKIFAGLEQSIADALAQTGESVQKQVAMIDQTMGQEIEKVMQSMGSALATISGKFTEDYSKLVRRMSDVVSQQA